MNDPETTVRPLLLAFAFALAVCPLALAAPAVAQEPSDGGETWFHRDDSGNLRLDLYFFTSRRCPHCHEARPFVVDLTKTYDWLDLHELEVTEHPENRDRFVAMTAALGERPRGVPAFVFCGQVRFGYADSTTSGHDLEQALLACWAAETGTSGAAAPSAEATVSLPFVGAVDVSSWSLPVTTVVIAALDAFNPCAFFVLLFLLSLLVNARSRARMLLVSSVFVLFSGLFYFLFMAAWLNVFLWVGELQAVTIAAGVIAIAVASLNIKDYFWFKRGPSLSIPESAKPGLFRRMRGLVKGTALWSVLGGTIVLAMAANSYELLCTSGFPLVYTRILTLEDLPRASYYLYLGLYNFVYVLPLVAIIAVFVFTLGRRKLQEEEGRILKLVSGLMMLGLGILLLGAPEALTNFFAAAGLLALAIVATVAIVTVDRVLQRRHRTA